MVVMADSRMETASTLPSRLQRAMWERNTHPPRMCRSAIIRAEATARPDVSLSFGGVRTIATWRLVCAVLALG
jgi:hypothetical protein